MSTRIKQLQLRFPGLYDLLRKVGFRFFGRWLGLYPRPLAGEVRAATEVLRGARWNMVYGRGGAHEALEEGFSQYIGVPYTVAVNTGGMALQMSMRALGLKPGNEVILQADTCSAGAFAVMNAGCTPMFADISADTFMLSLSHTELLVGAGTKAIIATHMWGNPEDIEATSHLAEKHQLLLIEDACLSLGATSGGRMVGSRGRTGVFSFGCIKPIQAGEGGMIVTGDEALARELRSLRHWGDRTLDFGTRDATQLAWNGRMPEIVAAVVAEQLKGYPRHLADLRDAVADFDKFLEQIPGLAIVLGSANSIQECAFTQVVLRLDREQLGCSKSELQGALARRGVSTWHANFEPIKDLSFFSKDSWKDWVLAGDLSRPAANYSYEFPVSSQVYSSTGLGLPKSSFLSARHCRKLKLAIKESLLEARNHT